MDKNPKELQPVLKEFKELIEGNTRIRMYFESMFEEVPTKKPYSKDPTGHKQMRNYHHMLEILNHILTTAPTWTDAAADVGMVGVPMNAIFDWPMGTARYERQWPNRQSWLIRLSGHAAFLDPEVNAMLKKVLNEWGKFLKVRRSNHRARM